MRPLLSVFKTTNHLDIPDLRYVYVGLACAIDDDDLSDFLFSMANACGFPDSCLAFNLMEQDEVIKELISEHGCKS